MKKFYVRYTDKRQLMVIFEADSEKEAIEKFQAHIENGDISLHDDCVTYDSHVEAREMNEEIADKADDLFGGVIE